MRIASTSRHHPLHEQRRQTKIPLGAQRFLAAFEGIEGGFAIGTSIVVALSVGGLSNRLLLITAIVSIVVNGFNTASVKYSSEHYLDELDGREKKSALTQYFIPAFIEFVSYFAISFVSVIPLIVLHNTVLAVSISVVITLVILFLAGFLRAYMLQMPRWRDAWETTLLGLGIILVGLVSGYVVHSL
ncbi:MAG TPA: VIT1/CCC1 transporter family protein [Candidatus Saccharibacteria bacterium]|nr:VIT1/CCC1 transporter family protein [Candidatus Saccharibacteria bacterium]